MANTYTQLYIHIVFAVKFRAGLISSSWKNELYKYITGIVSGNKQKLMMINGMEDHVHILISLNADGSISDLVRDIKAGSSKWINEQRLVPRKFEWQKGFGAFSISKSHIHKTVQYIINQEQHHKKKTFVEEYIEFLNAYEIPYDPKYIFHLPE